MKAIKTVVLVVLLLIPAINVHAELIQPQTNPESPYEVLYSGLNFITLIVNGEIFTIESRFSMPDGTWMTKPGSNGLCNWSRNVVKKDGYIHITDTFVNLSTDLRLPVRQRHTCDLAGRMKKAWVAGRTFDSGNFGLAEPANPTSYAITEKAGIGFMPLNDEMQVHVRNSSSKGILGLFDHNTVIPKGGTYSAEWVIVPTQRPDFWDFVNACRRIRNVNFTLTHMFAFVPTWTSGWDDNRLIRFIRNKAATAVASGYDYYEGRLAQGTVFQKLYPFYAYAQLNDRVRRLLPDVKPLVYFNSYLDSSDPADPMTEYQDDRTLLSDGTQATYGVGGPRIFFPTLVNGKMNKWGEAMVKNLDSILGFNTGDCKANGVYWDSIDYGSLGARYHYGEPWDGISGDIDEQTGKEIRLKSATILLGREWIVGQIQRIMNQGTLFTNSPPQIRTTYNLHFQGFAETWGDEDPSRAILYSPVALGNHLIERNVIDAYRVMIKALNYGCLYNWYRPEIQPEYTTLTKYMFPITPIELHQGYIIGQERIVTNRSGSFGWGDNSVHEVHVFGADGREVPCVTTPTKTIMEIGGMTYTTLQLADGWTAAIIRHPNGWKGPIGYCPVTSPWLNLLLLGN